MEIAAMRAEVEAGTRRREEDQQYADSKQVSSRQLSFILIHYTHMQLSSWNGVRKSNSQTYCCHGRVAPSKA